MLRILLQKHLLPFYALCLETKESRKTEKDDITEKERDLRLFLLVG